MTMECANEGTRTALRSCGLRDSTEAEESIQWDNDNDQPNHIKCCRNNDPAAPMLKALCGPEWTAQVSEEVPFASAAPSSSHWNHIWRRKAAVKNQTQVFGFFLLVPRLIIQDLQG
jgi:hypothetical protein